MSTFPLGKFFPFEVGMGYEWMVSLRKETDFVGKAALQRIKEEGVKRLLVGVEIEGEHLGCYNDGSMVEFFPVYAVETGERIGRSLPLATRHG